MKVREFFIHFKFYFLVSVVMLSLFSYYRLHMVDLYKIPQPGHEAVMEFGILKFSIIIITTMSLLLSTLSSVVDVFILKRIIRKNPLSTVLIIGTFVQCFSLFLLFNSFVHFLSAFLSILTGNELIGVGFEEAEPAIINFVAIIALSKLLIELDRKMGRGNFWKFLSGKFYKPREEERIFMFVDMKDSTATAEKMGHLKFSSLLQECFMDVSVVDENRAEIYQYVGDEVVLSWPKERGLNQANFLISFFKFINVLEKKAASYKEKYGVVPFFKGGANVGPVVVTEVGELKREITYHGDTLNTAARIEGLCNTYNARLLIPEELYKVVKDNASFTFEEVGCTHLKGREKNVFLYSVTEKMND